MERPPYRECYTSHFDRYPPGPPPDYCSIRGSNRGSGSGIRRPYGEPLKIDANTISPLDLMYKKRMIYPSHQMRSHHYEGPSYLNYRRSASRGEEYRNKDRMSSIDTSSPERPLSRYGSSKAAYPNNSLSKDITKSDAFREDVLRVVSPLLKQIRESIPHLSTEETKSSPRYQYGGEEIPKTDEKTRSDMRKIEKKLSGFERELNSFRREISQFQPDAILKRINEVKNQSGDLKKIVRESIEKYNRDHPSPLDKIDIEGKLKRLEKQLNDMDRQVTSVPRHSQGSDHKEDISELYSLVSQQDNQIRKFERQTNTLESNFSSLSTDIKHLQKSLTQVEEIAETALNSSNSPRQDNVTLPQVNLLIDSLEQKLTKSLTQVQNQLQNETKEELDQVFSEIQNLSEFTDNIHKKVVSPETISDLISQKLATTISSEENHEEIYALQQEIEQIQHNMEGYSETLRQLPKQDNILKRLEKIEKAQQQQALVDAAQDKKLGTFTSDEIARKVTQIQMRLDDQENELHSEVKSLNEDLMKLKQRFKETEDSLTDSVKTLDSDLSSITSSLNSQLEAFSEDISTLGEHIADLRESKGGPSSLDQDQNSHLNTLEAKIQKDHTKITSKLAELSEDVERSDELIKTSIQSLKDQTSEETSNLFEKILQIKNELIDDSRKLKERFERIDREENDKQEYVVKEIKRLEAKIDSSEVEGKDQFGIKSADKLGSTSNSDQVDSKLAQLREEIESKIEDLINATDEIRDFVVENEGITKETEQIALKNTQKIKQIEDKVFETLQKYERVASQTNEIAQKVDVLSNKVGNPAEVMCPEDFEGKPIQKEESKGLNDQFKMTDLFKDFNDQKDNNPEQAQARMSKGRYGIEDNDEIDDGLEPASSNFALKKAKEVAMKGIKDFEQYQKSHPGIDQMVSEAILKKWVKTAENAQDEEELEMLKDEIFDEAGYDIMEEIEESYEDPFEGLDGVASPKQVNELEDFLEDDIMKVVNDSGKPNPPKDEGSGQESEEYSEDYEDDFDF